MPLLLWNVTQRGLVVSYRRFGTACPETLVTDYKSKRHILENLNISYLMKVFRTYRNATLEQRALIVDYY